MSRVLVLGGSGFVGSAMVPELVEAGYEVRCLLRATSDVSRIMSLRWERVQGDIFDPSSLVAAMTGCDAVIHLAGLSSWDDIDSPAMRPVVVDGTRNVLDAATETGCRVVFVSSTATINGSANPCVFDETATWSVPAEEVPYAAAKRDAERLCLDAAAHGVDVVIVNPAEVYGPRDVDLITASSLLDFAKSWPVMVTRGGIAVVHVDDVARGIRRALEVGCAGERYILAGENVSIAKLARLTLSCLGMKKPVVKVPNDALIALARLAQRCGAKLPFNPKVLPYATRFWFVDASKAERELGVSFRSARAAVSASVDWLRAEGHVA